MQYGSFLCASALDIEVLVHDFLDGPGIVGDIGIAVDGVLDDGGGHSKIDHIHRLVSAHHGIDQTGGKCVTAADAVENIEREEFGFKGVTLIPHEGLQTVLGAGVRIAHMAGDTLNVGVALNEALENLILLFITGLQGNTVLPITLAVVVFILPQMVGFDTEEYVHIGKAQGAEISGFFPGPQLAAEIAVKTDSKPQLFGSFNGPKNKVSAAFV